MFNLNTHTESLSTEDSPTGGHKAQTCSFSKNKHGYVYFGGNFNNSNNNSCSKESASQLLFTQLDFFKRKTTLQFINPDIEYTHSQPSHILFTLLLSGKNVSTIIPPGYKTASVLRLRDSSIHHQLSTMKLPFCCTTLCCSITVK